MLRYWVWLAQADAVGAVKVKKLLEHFASPEAIFYADESALRFAGLTEKEAASLLRHELAEADAILETCYQKNIRILTLQDSDYPAFLQEIHDPPPVLYCVGKLPDLSRRAAIGVVGARSASAYGLTCAKRLGYQIGRCGGVVVTGMARGIDSVAAEGALSADAPVIGVLGCGVDIVYPPENRWLFRDVARNGCILSEFPPQTPPLGMHFPQRNRIISGLSDGVIVVEAGEKSGSLITAELALEQGRDVFAVPGNIDNAACVGSNRLLRESAMLVTSGWDVMQEYVHRYPETIVEFRGGNSVTATDLPRVASPIREPQEKEPAPETKKEPIDITPLQASVSAEEFAILQKLQNGAQQVDELIAATGLPAAKALSSITLLQVKGYIQHLPGKRFALAEQTTGG